jgi:hypothetical protein
MARDDDRWSVRLADVRISRYWPWSVVAALVAIRRRDRELVRQAERIGRDLAESVVKRWQDTDERTDALIDLTRALKRLTWVLLVVGLATLGVTIWALAQS